MTNFIVYRLPVMLASRDTTKGSEVSRLIVLIAGVLGVVGVAIGAYAAHSLEKYLAEGGIDQVDISKRLERCEVAVKYHMTHVLALLVLGLRDSAANSLPRRAAALFFLLGIALFSGGLYSMVFLGQMGHWAIVPSGGLCFILGWCCVAAMAFTRESSPASHGDSS